ncbi:hypothetical protein [Dyadobacter frigoris]|nr:hypothetical protein [Dyadobacter frigoris]
MADCLGFMSYPDFDSPTVFAKLPDHKKDGSFSLAPQIKDYKTRQLYLPGTAGQKAEHLKNSPQAFTHFVLISTALEIHKQLN